MTSTIDTSAQQGNGMRASRRAPDPTYRLEGQFREAVPTGAFADGVRFLSSCSATVVTAMPGSPQAADRSVLMDVNGLVASADGSPMPSPSVIAAPGFDFPDLDFRLTGSARIRTADPEQAQLAGSVVLIDGWVNFESGELDVEARPA